MKYTLPHIPPSLLAIQPPATQKALARVQKRSVGTTAKTYTSSHAMVDGVLTVTILGLHLRSTANWRPSKMREKIVYARDVRRAVRDALKDVTPLAPPLTVTITRVGPRHIDSWENLPVCAKSIIDELASWLGVDDGDDNAVRYEVRQEKGAFAVEIRFVRRAESGE